MDLLDRYLAAIARHLPDRQKADVTAELRDVLLSQIEEEEERLGRPQSREELEALLMRFGHPLSVSGRYRRVQHLIGPEIFPFWWATIKAVTAVVLGVWLVAAVLLAVAGKDAEAVGHATQPSLVVTLVFVFGAVTLVSALVERYGKTRFLTKWRPRDLPPVGHKRRGRFERIVEIGMNVVFLLWWVGAIRFRPLVPDYGLAVELAPIWTAMFAPILAYGVFELGMNLLALLRPGLALVNRILSLLRNVFGLAILGVVYQAGSYLVVDWAASRPDVTAKIQANFDMGMRIGIVATLLVFAGLAAVDLWRLWQMAQSRRAGPLAA